MVISKHFASSHLSLITSPDNVQCSRRCKRISSSWDTLSAPQPWTQCAGKECLPSATSRAPRPRNLPLPLGQHTEQVLLIMEQNDKSFLASFIAHFKDTVSQKSWAVKIMDRNSKIQVTFIFFLFFSVNYFTFKTFDSLWIMGMVLFLSPLCSLYCLFKCESLKEAALQSPCLWALKCGQILIGSLETQDQ